ncbi:MAG: GFA family protein, partial [Mesorhizobium sp.]
MRIDGACHCGAITYEAEVDPEKTSICHCADCQQLTGTAFRVTVGAPEEDY